MKALTFTSVSTFIVCVVLSPLNTSFAQTSLFTTPLSKGDSGHEVLRLQRFLNNNGFVVAAVGTPGSSGNETMYFGPSTERAVKKFQSQYHDEILAPLDLVSPTGYWGPRSIKKANDILLNDRQLSTVVPDPLYNSNPTEPQEISETRLTQRPTREDFLQNEQVDTRENDPDYSTAPRIIDVSPKTFSEDDTLVITGDGFTDLNAVVIDGRTFPNLPHKDGKIYVDLFIPEPNVEALLDPTIAAYIPPEVTEMLLDIDTDELFRRGALELYVWNANGESEPYDIRFK
jgi:peptidoglycan hydrolase-like protein with peptidoglycan-binding domain